MKLLTPALLAAVLLASLGVASAAPPATASCSPIERDATTPVYVLLYGYPHLPDKPERSLGYVDEDLLLMASFFDALAPRRVFVHGEPEPDLVARFGDDLRAPSWRSLRRTVTELTEAVKQHEPAAQVYVYLSGHGEQYADGEGITGVIFGRPEADADEPGYDGRIDSRLLAREVLAPLSAHADVHLIADACNSFYLLAARDRRGRLTRRIPKAPPPFLLAKPFAAQFGRVGASLATHDVTYETASVGGIFSHAVRTAAIGLSDLNGDGRISYREFHYALIWLLGNTTDAARPVVVSPGLDNEAVFIDWRSSPAARVCLPPELVGTHVIDTPDGRAVSLPLHPDRPSAIWLTPGREYAITGGGRKIRFTAREGALALADAQLSDARSPITGPVFTIPIRLTEAPLLAPVPVFEAPWYIAGAVTGAAGQVRDDALDRGWVPGALVSGRVGRGVHRLTAEVGWMMWTLIDDTETRFGTSNLDQATHVLVGRVGYDHLIARHGYEFSLAALAGGVQQLDEGFGLTPEATVRATTLLPIPVAPSIAVRLDGRFSVLPGGDALGTLFQLGLGVDYEWAL